MESCYQREFGTITKSLEATVQNYTSAWMLTSRKLVYLHLPSLKWQFCTTKWEVFQGIRRWQDLTFFDAPLCLVTVLLLYFFRLFCYIKTPNLLGSLLQTHLSSCIWEQVSQTSEMYAPHVSCVLTHMELYKGKCHRISTLKWFDLMEIMFLVWTQIDSWVSLKIYF